MKTREEFAHDLLLAIAGVEGLDHLGARWALLGWMVAESGSEPCDGFSGAQFNPLNTTLRIPGSAPFNSVGVQNYATYQDGIRATVDTLSAAAYVKVVAQLKQPGLGQKAAAFVLWEVVGSPWGTTGRDAYNGLRTFVGNKSRYNQLLVGG